MPRDRQNSSTMESSRRALQVTSIDELRSPALSPGDHILSVIERKVASQNALLEHVVNLAARGESRKTAIPKPSRRGEQEEISPRKSTMPNILKRERQFYTLRVASVAAAVRRTHRPVVHVGELYRSGSSRGRAGRLTQQPDEAMTPQRRRRHSRGWAEEAPSSPGGGCPDRKDGAAVRPGRARHRPPGASRLPRPPTRQPDARFPPRAPPSVLALRRNPHARGPPPIDQTWMESPGAGPPGPEPRRSPSSRHGRAGSRDRARRLEASHRPGRLLLEPDAPKFGEREARSCRRTERARRGGRGTPPVVGFRTAMKTPSTDDGQLRVT